MMIRTKLKIVICLCVTLAAISIIVVFQSFKHMERNLVLSSDINRIVRGVFALTVLTDEYLLHREKRPLVQWNQTYNNLASLIDTSSREPAHHSYPASLQDDFNDIKDHFTRLISIHTNPPFQDNQELSRQLESRLQSQILIKNQELVALTDRMEQRAEQDLLAGQKKIGWLILGLIAVICASVTGLALVVGRNVVGPLESLIKGAESIGEGNLDVRIDTEKHDEIGELSHAFNQMASRLKDAKVSQASLQHEVRHLDRVATMGTLSAAITHEINQPLAAILSNAQAALRFLDHEQPDLNQVREALQDIVSDDKRAGEVIRRLRIILRKDDLKNESLEFNEVINEIIDMIHSEVIIKNASITMDLKGGVPTVYGDRIQIQQVILNLIINALDAVTDQPVDTREILISTEQEADNIIIKIIDSGPGIDNDKLETIFDTFYTTKTTGIGMGLPICRSIVEKHNGRIWASNNPEGGATFTFALPITKHDASM